MGPDRSYSSNNLVRPDVSRDRLGRRTIAALIALAGMIGILESAAVGAPPRIP